MRMSRVLSTAAALVLLVGSGFSRTLAEPSNSPAQDALAIGMMRLERAAYADALQSFERALDLFASAQKLDDAQRAYMQLFVTNRNYANVLMKAMKSWVDKRRSDLAAVLPGTFAAFDAWVKERDALAAATINLVHNSPDWK
jgi:hypothetical protein